MRRTLLLMTLLLPALAVAKPWWLGNSSAREEEFLPPDAAFQVSSQMDGALVRIRWRIADGYYLYRSRFDISAASPGLVLEPAQFPPGISHTDAYFGAQEIFQNQVEALVGFKRLDAGAHPLQIKVAYQGCATAGLCYPLLVKVLEPESAASPMASPMMPEHPLGSSASDGGAMRASRHSRAGQGVLMLACLIGAAAFFLAGLARRSKPFPVP